MVTRFVKTATRVRVNWFLLDERQTSYWIRYGIETMFSIVTVHKKTLALSSCH